jgi:hypothetical protein
VVFYVLGTVAALLALVTLVGGAAIVASTGQRATAKLPHIARGDFSTSTYAIVSEPRTSTPRGADWAVESFRGRCASARATAPCSSASPAVPTQPMWTR